MYRIEFTSQYEELWRYNIIMTCGGYNALNEQLYVVGCERTTSEEFQTGATTELNPPTNFDPSEPLVLECKEAESIHAIVYVITHTLPLDRKTESTPPFPFWVKIVRDGEQIYSQKHFANGWGGATVNIKI